MRTTHIILCILFITASLAGMAWSATPVSAMASSRLQDLQFGERGRYARIVLICSKSCSVSSQGDGFFIDGLTEEFSIDLSDRSENATALRFEGAGEAIAAGLTGGVLSIDGARQILRSSVKPCPREGQGATCIDLEFAPQRGSDTAAGKKADGAKAGATSPAITALRDLDRTRTSRVADAQEKPGKTKRIANAAEIEPPADPIILRESRQAKNATQNGETPKTGAEIVNANTSAAAVSIAAAGARLEPAAASDVLARITFREESERLTGLTIDQNQCAVVDARLQADAWALDAMTVLGFCHGADGDFELAETIFKRLTALDPNNHRAWIGRALIAASFGERSGARQFFESAMAADPPGMVRDAVRETLRSL